MAELTKVLNHGNLHYGDIVRLTRAIKGSSGKRFKFLGAVLDLEDGETALYYDLVDIKNGHLRAIRPAHVIKEVAASKASQAKIKKKDKAEEPK